MFWRSSGDTKAWKFQVKFFSRPDQKRDPLHLPRSKYSRLNLKMASTSKAIFSFICLALLLPLSSCNCVAPLYSHRTPSAHAWLASRLRSKNVVSLSSARWSQLGRLPPPPAPPSFTLLDSVSRQVGFSSRLLFSFLYLRLSLFTLFFFFLLFGSLQFVNWLHQHSHPSHPRNFSITPIERPGFKSEGTPFNISCS